MHNQTAYLVAPGRLVLKDSEMPQLGPEDVLVQQKHIGLCGSDVTAFHDPHVGGIPDGGLPVVIGHECAGVVVATGEQVTHLKVGDRVALEPGVPCGTCEWCRSGKYNLCPDVIFMAAPPFVTGAFSRYVRHPANLAFLLPEHVSTVEGALIEPFAVGIHASGRGEAQPGKTVAILGMGCIGLMTLLACRMRGVTRLIVADQYENRLQKAREFGADVCVNTTREDFREAVLRYTASKGADIVFETAGSPATAAQTPYLVKAGGKIVMVGNIHGETPFDFFTINSKEADVISVFRYRNVYPLAIESIANGLVDVKPMVTHTYPFEQVQQAFQCALQERQTALKVMVEMG